MKLKNKDYPAMKIIVMILNIFTGLAIFLGVVQIFFLLGAINTGRGGSLLILLQLLGTAFGATLLKFSAETIKILCDIAFYLKSINEKTK
tara:strand:+ start:293 stop:562 length:270 start_codon:yes stop_codon:yes gene_type:complete